MCFVNVEGGAESLISSYANMIHNSIQDNLIIGLTDRFIQLLVGMEDIKDTIEDLKNYLLRMNIFLKFFTKSFHNLSSHIVRVS